MEPRQELDLDRGTEFTLVGMAIVWVQRVEFLLYGLGSHLAYLPDYRGKRFRELDPEMFLGSNPKNFKETLGGLTQAFGDKLLLDEEEIRQFVEDRNLLVHNYWRLTRANLRGGHRLDNPEAFLMRFIEQCDHWEKVLNGLLAMARQEAATRRGEELVLRPDEVDNAEYYRNQVELCLRSKTASTPNSPLQYHPDSTK